MNEEELRALLGDKFENVKEYFDKNTIPKARFNEISQKLKLTEQKQQEYEKQIEEAKTLINTSEELKSRYNTLEAKYHNDLKMKDKEIQNVSKRFEIESELTKQGAKHIQLLLKEIDLETYNDKSISTLKETYPDLFKVESIKDTPTPPSTEGGDDEWSFFDKL